MPRVELLNDKQHDRAAFSCGESTLDRYLREQAAQHHRDGIATTHVLVAESEPSQVLGYYTLSAAQLLLDELQEDDRRRLPRYPVPAVRMGRLAVASAEQGKGYGGLLMGHAVARCLGLRKDLGVRVMVVDALNDAAVAFYKAYGLRPTSDEARTLYLPLGKP